MTFALGLGLSSRANDPPRHPSDGTMRRPVPGEAYARLPTTLLEAFEVGKAEFAAAETVEEGLGLVFNNDSCAACHAIPATGGTSNIVETRIGRVVGNTFDPLIAKGGPIIQDNAVGDVTVGSKHCFIEKETIPAEANVVAKRLTTPLFGLGLVEAVNDATLVALARAQAQNTPSTAGIVNMVPNLVTGGTSVGRFGWKSQVATLEDFAGDAYLNEMGITSPAFPNESCPGGDCSLLACDPVPDPDDSGDGIEEFTSFMRLLAPIEPLPRSATASRGAETFAQIGCVNCHVSEMRTGQSDVPALSRVTFSPYSDFLLHDMGTLGDGITQSLATAKLMRTAPLWGLRFREQLLHDGRANTIAEAIEQHQGQGAGARGKFLQLPCNRKDDLLEFLNGL